MYFECYLSCFKVVFSDVVYDWIFETIILTCCEEDVIISTNCAVLSLAVPKIYLRLTLLSYRRERQRSRAISSVNYNSLLTQNSTQYCVNHFWVNETPRVFTTVPKS